MERISHAIIASCGAVFAVYAGAQLTEGTTMAIQENRNIATDETSSLISSDKVEARRFTIDGARSSARSIL
jgi:hypothetical protein